MDLATLEALAGGATGLDAALRLAGSGALTALTRDAAGRRLSASCAGTGEARYAVRADLTGETPRLRCGCPSRKRPCKHALALLLCWTRGPGDFELTGQLEALPTVPSPPPPPAPPRVPGPSAGAALTPVQRRKVRLQQQGLALAQRLLEALVVTGLGTLDAPRAESLGARARELDQLHLAGLATGLRRLVRGLAETDVPLGLRHARAVREITWLSALVARGTAWTRRREEGSAAETPEDAAIEGALGRIWTLAELTARGWTRPLCLLELSWERRVDAAREERVESSTCVDLRSGAWFHERAYVPLNRASRTASKASHPLLLEVADAAVYPGFGEPRVRWRATGARPRPGTPADWEHLQQLARPWEEARAAFEAQRAHPLAPRTRHALIAVKRVVQAGPALALEDPTGARHGLGGPPEALAALALWGVPADAGAAAVRLVASEAPGPLRVELLALLTPRGPVRLGS